MLAGDQVRVLLVLIDPRGLVAVGEVEQTQDLLALVVSAHGKDVVVVGLQDPGVRLVLEGVDGSADLFQLPKGLEDPSLAGGDIIAELRLVPLHVAAVQVAAVLRLDGIVVVSVVVQLADLVAAVDHRDAALGQQERVQHEVQTDRAVQLLIVLLVLRCFDAAEGSSGTAKSRVSQTRVVIVQLASCVALPVVAGEIIVQVLFVLHFLDAELLQEVVVQAPSDVVVASQIVEEDVLFRQLEHLLHLVA